MSKIRVLVVDDSPFIRKALLRIFESDDLIDVVGVARDGKEAIQKVQALKPDVVTLDVMMPEMNGIEVLKILMETGPVPVLMLSQFTQDGAELTLKALELVQWTLSTSLRRDSWISFPWPRRSSAK